MHYEITYSSTFICIMKNATTQNFIATRKGNNNLWERNFDIDSITYIRVMSLLNLDEW